MVPPFKEVVEACFVEGLVKAVFATETLAVGINMPAKTVVIEKLSKFTGERHEFLTPGQYYPADRAGRPPWQRRGRPGADRAVVAVRLVLRRRSPGWPPAAASCCAPPSAPPTTWPPTWCAGTRPTPPTTCSTCRSPSTRPTRPSSGSRPAWPDGAALAELVAEATCERRRRRGVPPAGRRPAPRADAPGPAASSTRPWPGSGPVTSIQRPGRTPAAESRC